MNTQEVQDRFRGCLLGLAVGDAVGTTLEFLPRGSYAPLTDVVGGGPFHLLPGQWTDDTSMALCLATSLLEGAGFNERDQMERYNRWATMGYLSSNGVCFDIGSTIRNALEKYRQTGDPFAGSTDARSAGNGSIMRLAPIPMFYYPDLDLAERFAAQSSRTTHAAAESVDASRLFVRIILHALSGRSKDEVLFTEGEPFIGSEKIQAIARGEYRDKSITMIRGSGYVVESLEAALWCYLHSDNFHDAVLMATNLGDDADTTAAICGQIAGATYGEGGIPVKWLQKLTMRQEIRSLADRLFHHN